MMPFGGMELIAVLGIALIIFGPKRLPEIGRTIGKATRDLKGGLREVQNVKDSVEDVKSSLRVDLDLKPKPATGPKPAAGAPPAASTKPEPPKADASAGRDAAKPT